MKKGVKVVAVLAVLGAAAFAGVKYYQNSKKVEAAVEECVECTDSTCCQATDSTVVAE